jgi:hypothetical protein
MSTDPTWCKYWTLVDRSHDSETYEHQLPNGMLDRVRSGFGSSVSDFIVFVPNAVVTAGPYR